MRAEGAKIGLYNGTSDPGVLARTGDYLQGKGANLTTVHGCRPSLHIDDNHRPYR